MKLKREMVNVWCVERHGYASFLRKSESSSLTGFVLLEFHCYRKCNNRGVIYLFIVNGGVTSVFEKMDFFFFSIILGSLTTHKALQ